MKKLFSILILLVAFAAAAQPIQKNYWTTNSSPKNGSSLTNLLSGKNEASLSGARFAAGKAMMADYTYPSFTNLLTVTIISESWSWVANGWHKQLETKLKEHLGNGGEFSLLFSCFASSTPTPTWGTYTNGLWTNGLTHFTAGLPSGAGNFITFTNLYCRYADIWYQPQSSATMQILTNGVLAFTTDGSSSLATNYLVDFGELKTHTLVLTNAGQGMRVIALNALTGNPGVNVRSISFSGFQASQFPTNVGYLSLVNNRVITNDCFLIRHGLNEYLTLDAAVMAGFETNLWMIATNLHTTFPVASVVLMSSPQVGTLSTVYADEINVKVRRMAQTNAWIYYSDGLDNQWTAADGATIGAWQPGDNQHYNSRGYNAYANYICRDVFGFTPSATRRKQIWLNPFDSRVYSGGSIVAPAGQGAVNEIYYWQGKNTLAFPYPILSGASKQLAYSIPSDITDGSSTFALTQYYLTTNAQPVATFKEIGCFNMDDQNQTVKLGGSPTTYQQTLTGTNVFRVREVFSIGKTLSDSFNVTVLGGVNGTLTNTIWYLGAKLEAW